MIKKYYFILIIFILFISCSSYDCSKIDNTLCDSLCEQARTFTEKLLKYPDDWICIMENERCIDCKEFLQNIYTNKNNKIIAARKLSLYSELNCKITACYEEVLPRIEIEPVIPAGTRVITVRITYCDPEGYDPRIDGHVRDLDIIFKLLNNNNLSLLSFWAA